MEDFLGRARRWASRRVEVYERLVSGAEPGRGAGLAEAIRRARGRVPGIIVEYKRCSPSSGVISMRDPEEYIGETVEYAVAYSVLTEPRWFCGSMEFIPIFSRHLPVLAKDFIVSRVQVEALHRAGASGVLLIWDLVGGGGALASLCSAAAGLGLDPLIEAHGLDGAMESHRACPSAIIGVNSRDLKKLSVDFDGMLRAIRVLRDELGDGVLLVAESGVDRPERAVKAFDAGADAILVGTAVMRDPGLLRRIWALYGSPR